MKLRMSIKFNTAIPARHVRVLRVRFSPNLNMTYQSTHHCTFTKSNTTQLMLLAVCLFIGYLGVLLAVQPELNVISSSHENDKMSLLIAILFFEFSNTKAKS